MRIRTPLSLLIVLSIITIIIFPSVSANAENSSQLEVIGPNGPDDIIEVIISNPEINADGSVTADIAIKASRLIPYNITFEVRGEGHPSLTALEIIDFLPLLPENTYDVGRLTFPPETSLIINQDKWGNNAFDTGKMIIVDLSSLILIFLQITPPAERDVFTFFYNVGESFSVMPFGDFSLLATHKLVTDINSDANLLTIASDLVNVIEEFPGVAGSIAGLLTFLGVSASAITVSAWITAIALGIFGLPRLVEGIIDWIAFPRLVKTEIRIPPYQPGAENIDKGLEYLRQRHASYPNGSWYNNVGITSLATLAFLNHGYDETDPDVQSAIQYILSNVRADGSIYNYRKNYETSLALLPLKATRNPDYSDEIENAKNWLINSQWDDDCLWGSVPETHWYWGGFGYGSHERPDISNTQFSLLALDAADLAISDSTWSKAVEFVSRSQNLQATNDGYSYYNDGGFIYLPAIGGCISPGCASYGSATGAGMWGLALSGLTPTDPRFAAALEWVESNYTWDNNPLTDGSWGTYSLYYYYLSMSKALSMARKTKIGDNDWYQQLREKIAGLQRDDGSWANSNSGLWENVPELATSYALLALQTRQLPPAADLEMVIILHSPADIHLYDDDGNHVGKNYDSSSIDLEIPGSSYSPDDPQTISIHPPSAGNYHLELVGTSEGDWEIEIIGYQDGVQASYDSYAGSITPGAVIASGLNVGAFEGGLTIFSSEPVAAAVMDVSPGLVALSGSVGASAQGTFTVLETGGSETIQDVTMFASDLDDGLGNTIAGASIGFVPTGFDVPASGSQEVVITVPLETDLPDGIYEGTITVESLNAGTKSIQLSSEVISNLPPILDIPAEIPAQYSDPLTLDISASDPNDLPESLTFTATALPANLIFSDNGNGTATVSGQATAAPGAYGVTFTVSDPEGLTDGATVTILINPEDAVATYTGPMLVSTPCTDCSTATVPLRATIQDISAILGNPAYDPDPGDITLATVDFINRDTTNVLCSASVILLDAADSTIGSAFCEWEADIGANDGYDFNLGILVDGYYTRNSTADDAIVVVSKPSENSITGGGYLLNQSTAGLYAGDENLRTHFGFNVKIIKNKKGRGQDIVGRATAIIRQGDNVYRIKTNALDSLIVQPASENDPAVAEFLSKASIEDVTDPNNPILMNTRAVFNFTITDFEEASGQYRDLLGITLWGKNGKLLFSSNWTGTQTIEQAIEAGNLEIHQFTETVP